MKSERTLARIGVIATLILLFATITTLYIGSTGAPKLVGQHPGGPRNCSYARGIAFQMKYF